VLLGPQVGPKWSTRAPFSLGQLFLPWPPTDTLPALERRRSKVGSCFPARNFRNFRKIKITSNSLSLPVALGRPIVQWKSLMNGPHSADCHYYIIRSSLALACLWIFFLPSSPFFCSSRQIIGETPRGSRRTMEPSFGLSEKKSDKRVVINVHLERRARVCESFSPTWPRFGLWEEVKTGQEEELESSCVSAKRVQSERKIVCSLRREKRRLEKTCKNYGPTTSSS